VASYVENGFLKRGGNQCRGQRGSRYPGGQTWREEVEKREKLLVLGGKRDRRQEEGPLGGRYPPSRAKTGINAFFQKGQTKGEILNIAGRTKKKEPRVTQKKNSGKKYVSRGGGIVPGTHEKVAYQEISTDVRKKTW